MHQSTVTGTPGGAQAMRYGGYDGVPMSYVLKTYRSTDFPPRVKREHHYPVQPSNRTCKEQIEEDDGDSGVLTTYVRGQWAGEQRFDYIGYERG